MTNMETEDKKRTLEMDIDFLTYYKFLLQAEIESLKRILKLDIERVRKHVANIQTPEVLERKALHHFGRSPV